MNKLQHDQKGAAHILLIVIGVIVLGVISYSVFRLIEGKNSTYTAENSEAKAKSSAVKIKSMPVDIGIYDPETKRAGDLLFPDQKLPEGVQPVLFSEFGYKVPGNSANNFQAKASPQPTFIVAGGTKVKAMLGKALHLREVFYD